MGSFLSSSASSSPLIPVNISTVLDSSRVNHSSVQEISCSMPSIGMGSAIAKDFGIGSWCDEGFLIFLFVVVVSLFRDFGLRVYEQNGSEGVGWGDEEKRAREMRVIASEEVTLSRL